MSQAAPLSGPGEAPAGGSRAPSRPGLESEGSRRRGPRLPATRPGSRSDASGQHRDRLPQQAGEESWPRLESCPPAPTSAHEQASHADPDRLPLYQNASWDAVIACRERLDRHPRPETQKRGRDSAPALKDIRHDHGDGSALFPVHEMYTKQSTGRHHPQRGERGHDRARGHRADSGQLVANSEVGRVAQSERGHASCTSYFPYKAAICGDRRESARSGAPLRSQARPSTHAHDEWLAYAVPEP